MCRGGLASPQKKARFLTSGAEQQLCDSKWERLKQQSGQFVRGQARKAEQTDAPLAIITHNSLRGLRGSRKEPKAEGTWEKRKEFWILDRGARERAGAGATGDGME